MKKYDILEIGCGTPEFIGNYPVIQNNILHYDISKLGYHIEVNGDAHYLPFKDNSFNLVYISHVLEHCENPIKVLHELKRISIKGIILKVPNSVFHRRFDSECHIYSWNVFTLKYLLEKVFSSVNVYPTYRLRVNSLRDKIKLFILMFFFQKNELTAVCKSE